MSDLAINGGVAVRTGPFPSWPPQDAGHQGALERVLKSGVWGVGGAEGKAFCEEFARFCDAQYAVACTSGTTALEIALMAAGIGVGDEVIVPPYTFIATASSCAAVNSVPVFADIDPRSFNLSPPAAEAAITGHTAAIIGVHVGGMPCNLGALKAIADRRGLALIEDAAQAHGAVYRGQKVGAQGTAGAFSFQSSKNLCAGEGGAVVSNDRSLYEKAWSLHNCGRAPEGGWYDHRILGFNLRMTEFQAALLRYQLQTTLGTQMELREQNACYLRSLLSEIPGIAVQAFPDGAERSAWHLIICRYDPQTFSGLCRDDFLRALCAEGIPAAAGYNPLYGEPAFAGGVDYSRLPWAPQVYAGSYRYEDAGGMCPETETLCANGFWLFHSVLLGTRRDMDDIAEAIRKVQQHAGEVN